MKIKEFELFFFDLDGTVTESKSNLDEEMAKMIEQLLQQKKVVIISGAGFNQFQKQFIDLLPPSTNLKNLYLSPLTGGSFYIFKNNNWEKIYDEKLTKKEKEEIITVLENAVKKSDSLRPKKIFGVQIQDREGQITFSALGDKAPIKTKKYWDSNYTKRKKLKEEIEKNLPEFTVSIGGLTSIDIHKKNIDKSYGIEKISSWLSIPKEKILFIGDTLFEGGNDYSAILTGIHTQKVSGPKETKQFLKKLLKYSK